MVQHIINEALESVNELMERSDENGNSWVDLRAVKVKCLRIEHMMHVIEGQLGEE